MVEGNRKDPSLIPLRHFSLFRWFERIVQISYWKNFTKEGEERFPFNRYSWSGRDGCSARIRGQSKLHFDLCIRAGPKTVGFHVRLSLRIFEAQPSDFTDPWPINLVYLGGLSSLLYRGPAQVPVSGISLDSKISLVALNHACISLVISRIFHLFLLKVFQEDPRYFSKTLLSDRRIMNFYNNPIL